MTQEIFVVISGSQREHTIRRFKMVVECALLQLEKFSEDVIKEPQHAFEWSEKSFEAAAKLKVYQQAIYMLETGESLKNICETYYDNIINNTMYVSRSTSVTSNLLKDYHVAQYAEMLQFFRKIKDLEATV